MTEVTEPPTAPPVPPAAAPGPAPIPPAMAPVTAPPAAPPTPPAMSALPTSLQEKSPPSELEPSPSSEPSSPEFALAAPKFRAEAPLFCFSWIASTHSSPFWVQYVHESSATAEAISGRRPRPSRAPHRTAGSHRPLPEPHTGDNHAARRARHAARLADRAGARLPSAFCAAAGLARPVESRAAHVHAVAPMSGVRDQGAVHVRPGP